MIRTNFRLFVFFVLSLRPSQGEQCVRLVRSHIRTHTHTDTHRHTHKTHTLSKTTDDGSQSSDRLCLSFIRLGAHWDQSNRSHIPPFSFFPHRADQRSPLSLVETRPVHREGGTRRETLDGAGIASVRQYRLTDEERTKNKVFHGKR